MEEVHFIYREGIFIATENLKERILFDSSAPLIRVDIRWASLSNNNDFQLSKIAERLRCFVNSKYGTSFGSFGICQPEYIDRNIIVVLIVQLTSTSSISDVGTCKNGCNDWCNSNCKGNVKNGDY